MKYVQQGQMSGIDRGYSNVDVDTRMIIIMVIDRWPLWPNDY